MDFRNQGQGNANMEMSEDKQIEAIYEAARNAETYPEAISRAEKTIQRETGKANSCPMEIDTLARAAMVLGSSYRETDPSYRAKVSSHLESLADNVSIGKIGNFLYNSFDVGDALEDGDTVDIKETGNEDDACFIT